MTTREDIRPPIDDFNRPITKPGLIVEDTISLPEKKYTELEMEYMYITFSYKPTIKASISFPSVAGGVANRIDLQTIIDYPILDKKAKPGNVFEDDIDLYSLVTGKVESEVRESTVIHSVTESGEFVEGPQGNIMIMNSEGEYTNLRSSNLITQYKKNINENAKRVIEGSQKYKDAKDKEEEWKKNKDEQEKEKEVDSSKDKNNTSHMSDFEGDKNSWFDRTVWMAKNGVQNVYPGLRDVEGKSSVREKMIEQDPTDTDYEKINSHTMFSRHKDLLFYTGFTTLVGIFAWRTGLLRLFWGDNIKDVYKDSMKDEKESQPRDIDLSTEGVRSIDNTYTQPTYNQSSFNNELSRPRSREPQLETFTDNQVERELERRRLRKQNRNQF